MHPLVTEATGFGRHFLKAALPYGLVVTLQSLRRNKMRRRFEKHLLSGTLGASGTSFDYEAAIRFFVDRGHSEEQIRAGSMPRESLDLFMNVLRSETPGPLLGLHVGNFVGVSLAAVAHCAREISKDALIVSVDPDIAHRGVEYPQREVTAFLSFLGLTRNVAILASYSLEKCVANDGIAYSSSDNPARSYARESSCECGLENLLRLSGEAKFQFVLIDGNHDEDYVWREIQVVEKLLAPNGLLVLDDVSETWPGIQQCFEECSLRMVSVVRDDRIGILRKNSDVQMEPLHLT